TTAHMAQPGSYPILMARGHQEGYLYGGDDRGSAPAHAAWCRAAVAVQPGSVVAWSNLGAALRASGKLPEAAEALRQAVRLDPKYAPARTNLGTVLYESGDLPGAIAAHREAVRLE